MNDKVSDLTLEHLRAFRAKLARIDERIAGMQAEMTALRLEVAALSTLQNHDHGEIAALQTRVDRIERRLDLID